MKKKIDFKIFEKTKFLMKKKNLKKKKKIIINLYN